MRPTVRRCLIGAVLIAALVPASAFGSMAVNPGKAARTCAAGRGIKAPLGTGSARDLVRFVPCVLKQERAAFRLDYTQSKPLSLLVGRALGRVVTRPDLTPQDAAGALGLAVQPRIATLCPRDSPARWAAVLGDTASHPAGTPLEFADLLSTWLTATGVPHARKAVFGVAAPRGLTLTNGDLKGAVFGVVALVCA
jgi:hypothetical protein